MGQADRNELADLVHRLGRWLDEKRFNEAPALFTEDASVETSGGRAQGREALAEQASRNHRDETTQHFITDPLIEVTGERATVEANLLVVFAGDGRRRLLGERYRLNATRTSGGWRFSRVEVQPVWEIAGV